MTGALALLIDVRASVPIMSIALILSHGARSLMNMVHINYKAFAVIMVAATPFIVLTALIYTILPVRILAGILAVIVFTSIPIRHWAKARNIKAGYGALAAIGAIYGFFAGASIGAVALLSPFLLGFGLVTEAFVATMAIISMSTNVVRIGVFGGADVLTSQYALLGLLVGLIMVPGNWIGRAILRRMTVTLHGYLVDGLAVLGALNFVYLAITS